MFQLLKDIWNSASCLFTLTARESKKLWRGRDGARAYFVSRIYISVFVISDPAIQENLDLPLFA